MALIMKYIINKNINSRLNILETAFKAYSSSDVIPKNKLEKFVSAYAQPEIGVVYDKKPLRITLEAGKNYSWCACGKSKNNPFCDGTHKIAQLKITLKPVRFQVEETKEYWLCNCKHTAHRPFCDGTHKTPTVQEANSIVRQ